MLVSPGMHLSAPLETQVCLRLCPCMPWLLVRASFFIMQHAVTVPYGCMFMDTDYDPAACSGKSHSGSTGVL